MKTRTSSHLRKQPFKNIQELDEIIKSFELDYFLQVKYYEFFKSYGFKKFSKFIAKYRTIEFENSYKEKSFRLIVSKFDPWKIESEEDINEDIIDILINQVKNFIEDFEEKLREEKEKLIKEKEKEKIFKEYTILTNHSKYCHLFFNGDGKLINSSQYNPIFDEDEALSCYYNAIKKADFEIDDENDSYSIYMQINIYHYDVNGYEDCYPIFSYIGEKTEITKNEEKTIIENKRIPFVFLKEKEIKIDENGIINLDGLKIDTKNFETENCIKLKLHENEELQDYIFIADEELNKIKNNNKYEILY